MSRLPHEEMLDWAQEELERGNRVKASRIFKVSVQMKERQDRYLQESEDEDDRARQATYGGYW